MAADFPQLQQMFGCYFHQDWDLEAEDWPGLVSTFARESTANLSDAATEIDVLLSQFPDDAGLKGAVYGMASYYDPRPDIGGLTMREWLQQVADYMRTQNPDK